MSKYLITIKNYRYRTSIVPFASVSYFTEVEYLNQAYDSALWWAERLFGSMTGESRYSYLIEETPIDMSTSRSIQRSLDTP